MRCSGFVVGSQVTDIVCNCRGYFLFLCLNVIHVSLAMLALINSDTWLAVRLVGSGTTLMLGFVQQVQVSQPN